jgi:glycerol-3-phosphate dehydrogenase
MTSDRVRADVVIVGGGIQGATMALAASRKGLKPLLVERGRVAGGATGNSYGVVHGGLRYLQSLDVARWRRSRRAQAWFLANHPRFVRPLACVMPLYRWRLRSASAFRVAVAMENALARTLDVETPLPPARLLTIAQVEASYPAPRRGLTGAALWHDAEVTDMAALVGEILAKANLDDGALRSFTAARTLCVRDDRVAGLDIVDLASGAVTTIETDCVINCAGSWSQGWRQGQGGPSAATLAFNLLLDLPFQGDAALAVSETPGAGRSYFLRPVVGGVLAGTFYRPAPGAAEPSVSSADVAEFLARLDKALPGFGLATARVLDVSAGLLPDVDGAGVKLSSADHVSHGPPAGLHTIVGGKFTTAPLLSFDVAERLWPSPRRPAIRH